MKRKLWVLFLGLVLFLVPLGPVASGQAKPDEPSRLDAEIAKIKTAISKRVADDKTRVELKLRSGVESKGRISQAGNNDFTFTADKGGQQTTFAYADVERVKGRGLSSGAKIGIIAGIAVAAAAVAIVVAGRNFDPFKNGIPIRGVAFR